jgi:A/G-specific adenine glycosylase
MMVARLMLIPDKGQSIKKRGASPSPKRWPASNLDAMQRQDVVIGIVIREGRILICQRRRQDTLGGYWEFPGGKLEADESLEQCLARELREELAIKATVIEAFPTIEYDYPSGSVRLHPYLCQHVQGEPKPLASQELAWVAPADLGTYPFPLANDGLIRELQRRFCSS